MLFHPMVGTSSANAVSLGPGEIRNTLSAVEEEDQ